MGGGAWLAPGKTNTAFRELRILRMSEVRAGGLMNITQRALKPAPRHSGSSSVAFPFLPCCSSETVPVQVGEDAVAHIQWLNSEFSGASRRTGFACWERWKNQARESWKPLQDTCGCRLYQLPSSSPKKQTKPKAGSGLGWQIEHIQ